MSLVTPSGRFVWLLALCLVLGQPGRAGAADPVVVELETGQPAPTAGFLFNEAAILKTIEDGRDLKALRAQLETMSAALATKDQETAHLREALQKMTEAARDRELALVRAEERDRIRAEIDAKNTAMLDRMERALEKSDAALTRAERRIGQLESRSGWAVTASGILGLLLGLFGGGFTR